MPTILDALMITVGLDISDYQKKQKEAASTFAKTKEAAVKGAKDIESAAAGSAAALKKVALEAIALFAVFTGASSLKGFVTDLISANTQLGYFADRIGGSPQAIDAWEKAAERVGGTAGATAGSFQKIADALNDLHVNGKALPQAFYQLQAWSGQKIDTEHGAVAFMEGLARASQDIAKSDPGRAAFLLQQIGIDPGTISLMIQGGDALDRILKSSKQLTPTNEQIKASQELTAAWVEFQQTLISLGNTVIPVLNNVLGPALEAWSAWVDKNRELINSKVNEVLKASGDALNNINWSEIVKGMGDFAAAADNVAAAVSSIATGINGAISSLQTLDRLSHPNTKENSTSYGPSWLNASVRKGSIADTVMGWFGAGPSASAPGGSASPPGRAVGGSTSPGRQYLVGEHGPEVLSMGGVGAITPNGSLNGDLSVDGRTVTKTNPVPVELTNGGGGGENWLQTAGRLIFGDGAGSGGDGGILSGVGHVIKGMVGAVGGGASGGPYNPAVGAPGTYRPQYKLGARDLSDSVVNTIAGEATSKTESIDAVINNMFNRLGTTAYGPSGDLQAVARAPGQYAGYAHASPELAARIRERIKAIAAGTVPDNTNGSNEYRAGWYNGPWGRKHADSPVVGGNRFAYNPRGGRGPLAAYDRPHATFAGGAQFAAAVKASQTTNNSTSSSNTTHIGTIQIHTQAKDGPGVAAALQSAIQRTAQVASANTGLR